MILQREQYSLIYRVSYLSLIASLYGLYKSQYALFMVPGSVFISSINYWYKPDYSWRRYADMAVVKTALIYQNIMAYNAENARAYYIIMTLAMLSYPIGIYYSRRGEYWKSTYAHILIHIFGNIGNIVLYSGYV